MKYLSKEECDKIKKEAEEMIPKNWASMYFDEQSQVLKKDKKHNYIHCLIRISDDYDRNYNLWRDIFAKQQNIIKKIYKQKEKQQEFNIKVLMETLRDVCEGYVKPAIYGTEEYEKAEKFGGIFNYLVLKTEKELKELKKIEKQQKNIKTI